MPDTTQAMPKPKLGFDIEELGINVPIEGDPGADVNHASPQRLQFLVAQHASIITQTQFADAKAAGLMTVMCLLAMNGPVKITQTGPDDLLAIVIFALMMATVGIAISAIFPRYPNKTVNLSVKRSERFAWPALVAQGYSPLDHAEFMRNADATQLVMSLAQSNSAVARVLESKFKALRLAFLTGAFDLALIVLHVIIDHGLL